MLPDHLTKDTYRAKNGEYGWRREQVPAVVAFLRQQLQAVLGGELWWVLDPQSSWSDSIPQREGPDSVYHWETERRPSETWRTFVDRCAARAVEASEVLPGPDELPAELPGQILYNLTWVSETEYGTLGTARRPLA
jgi:hypothetical protein